MPAHVKSTQAIREFRSGLQEYRDSLRQSLDMLITELARAVDYFESDRAAYWPAQERKASDRLAEARINLGRCQMTTRDGQHRPCYEEKKALQRAKARLQFTRDKVAATKKWTLAIRREADQFKMRLAKLSYLTDHELPRAIAVLERLANQLDRYVGKSESQTSDKSS